MDINRRREECLTTMVRGTSRYTGESAAQVCWTASSGGLAENSWSALLLSLPAGPGPSLLCAVRPSSACVRASAGRCQQRTDLRAATPDPAITDEWIYEPCLSERTGAYFWSSPPVHNGTLLQNLSISGTCIT